MSKKRKNQTINVYLGGKTLLIVCLYSVLMMGLGAGFKSCDSKNKEYYEKITNTKVKTK